MAAHAPETAPRPVQPKRGWGNGLPTTLRAAPTPATQEGVGNGKAQRHHPASSLQERRSRVVGQWL